MDDLSCLFGDLNLNLNGGLNLIKSSRNKKDGTPSWLLFDVEKHEYKSSYKSTSGKITWRCNNTDFPNCPGSVYTFGHNLPIYYIKDHDIMSCLKFLSLLIEYK
ncbi:hypothetical protein BpHYR1_004948 [Brachionus plicatilis]|uniref:Uncharacterized protein n=1 Tax=Brachionus plicatilis TaxID=10195 RepID=A0A3M7QC43_BRAPC|nr:hypothetical protein BpHYR1_004948 [Brachionus plicatilis]